jgi:ankyrin repeat protein
MTILMRFFGSSPLLNLKTAISVLLLALSISPGIAEIKTEVADTPQTLFYSAIRGGQLDEVRKFLSTGMIDPNHIFDDGITPLHIAVINNQESIVAVLLQAGAKVNAQDNTTQATPLHLAAVYGRTPIAQFLIQKGADINAVMKFGITPLMTSAELKQPSITELLLNHKANVNCADQEGFTALHYSAQSGDELATRLLLESGADFSLRDRELATPMDVATKNNQIGVIQLLRQKGA